MQIAFRMRRVRSGLLVRHSGAMRAREDGLEESTDRRPAEQIIGLRLSAAVRDDKPAGVRLARRGLVRSTHHNDAQPREH